MLDFTSWLQQQNLNEDRRRDVMSYEQPAEPTVVRRPKRGDMLITSPGTFLNRSAGRKVYRNKLVKPWMITSEQDPATGMLNAVRTGTGMQKKFNVDDILHDVTDAYDNAEDRLGAHHVWLYIAPGDTQRKQEYERWAQKQQQLKQQAQQPEVDPNQQRDQETQMRIAKLFGQDQDYQNSVTAQDRKFNFDRQKATGTAQIDHDDDPRYVSKVAAPQPQQPQNSLMDRINLLRRQSAAARNNSSALLGLNQLRKAESYRYY